MNLLLEQISKRYSTGWVIKDLSKEIGQGQKVAVTGSNGSGKSTLIQLISGYLSVTKGKIIYKHDGQTVDRDDIFRFLAISAAYMELDEELTIKEIYKHYSLFKPVEVDYLDFLKLTDFEGNDKKQVRFFSSGMKQRLKLVLAICSDSPLLLLDEPTTNLDQQGMNWYRELVEKYAQNRLTIIASNVEVDYDFCDTELTILDYKKKRRIKDASLDETQATDKI